MFALRRKTQNELVARQMSRFFEGIRQERLTPAEVATEYGEFMWRRHRPWSLLKDKHSNRSRFYLGLALGHNADEFERVTKRAALISDTLLLSHHWTEPVFTGITISRDFFTGTNAIPVLPEGASIEVHGMLCPDLDRLGRWLLDGRPLLEAGLAWYLPAYSTTLYETKNGTSQQVIPARSIALARRAKAVDYLVKDGRAIDSSGANPTKSALIRPILSTDLPFIDGVGLRDFSRITVEEFDSYSAFRDFLRLRLLDLDSAMDAVDSDRALVRVGLEIQSEIRAFGTEIGRAKRKRLLVGSGAAIGTLSATLIGVYGPALQAAVTTIGATGGIWGFISNLADNDKKSLRESKWNYVWLLSRKAQY